VLINNYTAPALAAGLRDREETLQVGLIVLRQLQSFNMANLAKWACSTKDEESQAVSISAI
jgi:hypothetical protein